jgi:phenylacetate-coenzyme A ligase PaaK-like adenylate-forming protein
VQRELKGVLGIEVAVDLVPYGTLPRSSSKSQRIIDLREPPFRSNFIKKPEKDPTL